MKPQKWIRSIVTIVMLGLVATSFALNRPAGTAGDQGEAQGGQKPACAVYDSDRGRQLLGAVTREDFTAHLPDWDGEYHSFAPDPTAVEALAGLSDPVRIVCVLGTWCGDSQREVPRFWKILDEAQNPALEFSMLGVGRADDPEAERRMQELGFTQNIREKFGIEFVPTFIFLSGDEELGRIVETPTVSLEQDAVDLLTPSAPRQQWK